MLFLHAIPGSHFGDKIMIARLPSMPRLSPIRGTGISPVEDAVRPAVSALARAPGQERTMEVSCLDVIRELSSYIDQDVAPDLKAQIEAHLPNCRHCSAVYDGSRNVIRLVADERTFDLPTGFSQRLRDRLSKDAAR
jgi:anti-sigma factor (TIGR02949 family)